MGNRTNWNGLAFENEKKTWFTVEITSYCKHILRMSVYFSQVLSAESKHFDK